MMVEGNMEELPLPSLFEQARQTHSSASKSSVDQIVRFKRQKVAEAKLQEIKERKERRGRSLRAAALSTPVNVGEEDSLKDDGEEEREAWLSINSLALCKAFDLLEMLKKEEEILLAVKERQSKDGDHKHHQPLILGLLALWADKSQAKGEGLLLRLPTMSVEEKGWREMEMMNKWQERNAKAMKEATSSWHRGGPRSAEEEEECEEAKARAWDDWKDDNLRGAGNKKLTPFG